MDDVEAPSDAPVKAAITGGSGFVGQRLIGALRKRHPSWLIEAPQGPSEPGSGLDIADCDSVTQWVRDVQPDVLIHLAAIAAVSTSVRNPRLAWRVNLTGTLNTVLALQDHAPRCHLLYVSSAEVYGVSLNERQPTDESGLLQPVNPYAASKAAADVLVRQAAATGLLATVMRPFNHTGAGQSEDFVAPSFAGQIARIERGMQPPVLLVGSLDEERDFLDVEDVVSAYVGVLDSRQTVPPGAVFNVASGRSVKIGEILDILLSQATQSIEIKVDERRLRQSPIPRVIGDSSRLRDLIGWKPSITLKATLKDLLREQRETYARNTR